MPKNKSSYNLTPEKLLKQVSKQLSTLLPSVPNIIPKKLNQTTKKSIRNTPEFGKLKIPHWYLEELAYTLTWAQKMYDLHFSGTTLKVKENGTNKPLNYLAQNYLHTILSYAINNFIAKLSSQVSIEKNELIMEKQKELISTFYGRNVYINGKLVTIDEILEIFKQYWEFEGINLLENFIEIGMSSLSISRQIYYSENKPLDLSTVRSIISFK